MQSIAFVHRAQSYRYLICSATLVLLLNISAFAQRSSIEWYNSSVTERGEISELKDKQRVYISITPLGGSFIAPSISYQRLTLEQQVYKEIEQYGRLEIVKSPKDADFIIDVWITSVGGFPTESGPSIQRPADIKFSVYTRSEAAGKYGYGRRLILQTWKTTPSDITAVVRQEAAAFIRELKRVRGEK
ncbi:MAG: hypothetical protein ICV60_01935 [Pyrinomonadaceae bacterium]|nr:hypothetical protein [Pyrinomonadaceae bacterium]